MSKILAVDDDPRICKLLTRYLSQEGFAVSTAGNGDAMFRQIAVDPPDLIILDLMLPHEDGLTLARQLRERHDIGIIMLTGKHDVVDKIVGLEIGADDYITKPFDERELLARVRSVLRRARRARAPVAPTAEAGTIASFDGWRLDLKAYILTDATGERVTLTSYEFQILAMFLRHPNQALTREFILDYVTNRDYSPYDRSIDVLIGKLRRKIEPDPKDPTYIKTIRGTGYIFAAKVSYDGF